MSLQAKDLGQLRESVTLAETARAGYPGATPRIAAICDLRAAEAYACDRATTDCRRALDSAFDRLGDAPSSSGEPGWCYWLDEAQAHAMASFCYLHLQDWGRARQHLRTALRLQEPSCAREGSLRHILLAQTYLRQDRPEVDHAVSLASQAMETLTGEVDSARCVGTWPGSSATSPPTGDVPPFASSPSRPPDSSSRTKRQCCAGGREQPSAGGGGASASCD